MYVNHRLWTDLFAEMSLQIANAGIGHNVDREPGKPGISISQGCCKSVHGLLGDHFI